MRPLLSRQEKIDGGERRAELRREAMTPEQIEALMRKTIHSALDANRCVSRDDLLRANIDAGYIDRMFRPVLQSVIVERKKAGIKA